jgi:hypothetical protein
MGNRVYRKVEDISDPQNPAIGSEQKFLVDISSQLPVILKQIDTASGSLITSYVYADAQVLCQRNHDPALCHSETPFRGRGICLKQADSSPVILQGSE